MVATSKLAIIVTATDQASKIFQAIGASGQSMGKRMGNVGRAMALGLTIPIIGIGTAMVKTAGVFEGQMAIMGIAARSSGASIEELRSFAIKMGIDTVFSASEAALAMTGLFKAGMSAEEVMGNMTGTGGALKAAMDLAAASELDLANAADLITIAMATFGFEAEDAASITDMFIRAADASVASVGDLGQAMVNIGPTAAAMGWGLEDVLTALALLSEHGIKGSEAGTALKSMFTNLMRPTDAVIETMRAYNISLWDAEGNMKSLPAVIGELEGALGGMTEAERLLTVQTLAGTYGMNAMNVLVGEGIAGWVEMEEKIRNAATAAEVADARMNTWEGTLESMGGAIESLNILIMSPFIQDTLKPFIENVTGALTKVAELNPELFSWGIKIAGVVAAAGPLLIILGKVAGAIGVLKGVVLGIGGFLVSTLGWPILVITGLIAALALAWNKNWGGIQDKVREVIDAIKPKLEWVREIFLELGKLPFIGTVGRFAEGIAQKVGGVGRTIGEKLGLGAGVAQPVWETVTPENMPGFLGGMQQGGIVPKTGPYLMHQGEVVVPAGGGGGGITIPVTLELDGHVLARVVARYQGNELRRRGVRAMA